jgi:hypothetical protein
MLGGEKREEAVSQIVSLKRDKEAAEAKAKNAERAAAAAAAAQKAATADAESKAATAAAAAAAAAAASTGSVLPSKMDTNNDGSISQAEVSAAYGTKTVSSPAAAPATKSIASAPATVNVTATAARKTVAPSTRQGTLPSLVDTNHDGSISSKEFAAAYKTPAAPLVVPVASAPSVPHTVSAAAATGAVPLVPAAQVSSGYPQQLAAALGTLQLNATEAAVRLDERRMLTIKLQQERFQLEQQLQMLAQWQPAAAATATGMPPGVLGAGTPQQPGAAPYAQPGAQLRPLSLVVGDDLNQAGQLPPKRSQRKGKKSRKKKKETRKSREGDDLDLVHSRSAPMNDARKARLARVQAKIRENKIAKLQEEQATALALASAAVALPPAKLVRKKSSSQLVPSSNRSGGMYLTVGGFIERDGTDAVPADELDVETEC